MIMMNGRGPKWTSFFFQHFCEGALELGEFFYIFTEIGKISSISFISFCLTGALELAVFNSLFFLNKVLGFDIMSI